VPPTFWIGLHQAVRFPRCPQPVDVVRL
jgi:hypothetical protein